MRMRGNARPAETKSAKSAFVPFPAGHALVEAKSQP
jgi:hypothetical protein